MIWLIPVLPLAGFIINGLLALGSARSDRGPNRAIVGAIAVAMPALSFVITVLLTLHLASSPVHRLQYDEVLWTWLVAGPLHLSLGFVFDHLAAMMLIFVTGIGSLIHLYSIGYMWEDRGFARFMSYLNLFMVSMIVLVLGDSLPATFLGWEGVGLCSYLLIGFWHREEANNDAARKAFVVNRIGDFGFLLGAFALVVLMGPSASLRYADISHWLATHGPQVAASGGLITAAAALIFLGCTGKSAQIPLLTWLPDAMAGPTPVSALIHAATMVTSGVYLVARLADLFALAPAVLSLIMIIGCLTAVYGAVAGLVQQDIKKALAYSTVSQLGFMFMAAGVGAFDVALFHVFTHAFFKATLFLGAGSIIHALNHEQDMRRMGGLARRLPVTHGSMILAWWAIIGGPFGAGFFSKDLILDRLFAAGIPGEITGIIAIGTALLTSIYMTRLMYLVFWSPSRVPHAIADHIHEAPFTMSLPVFILGVGSMVAGVVWISLLTGMNHLQTYLDPVLGHAQAVIANERVMEAIASTGPGNPWMMPAIGSGVALLGWWIAHIFFRKGPATGASEAGAPLRGFAAAWTFSFDRLYQTLVVTPVRIVGVCCARFVDRDLCGGVLGMIPRIANVLGDGQASLQRGRLRSSMTMSLVGLLIIIALLLWSQGLP